MFHFRCPHCNAKLDAEDDWAGMEAACPKCSQTITIVPETTPEKPKIQLTPITVPSSADTQRPVSTQPQQPELPSTANNFPFICPLCGTLTELASSLQDQEYECPACSEKSIAVPATEKPCPYCGEMIKFRAKICRFCKKSVLTCVICVPFIMILLHPLANVSKTLPYLYDLKQHPYP